MVGRAHCSLEATYVHVIWLLHEFSNAFCIAVSSQFCASLCVHDIMCDVFLCSGPVKTQ